MVVLHVGNKEERDGGQKREIRRLTYLGGISLESISVKLE
jgi:hypothetical protein